MRGGCRQGAGRKSCWRQGRTQTIRVPVAIAEQLLEIGRQLDRGEEADTQTPLQALLKQWRATCDAQPPDDLQWQQVRQLLSEIDEVLAQSESLQGCPRWEGGHRHRSGRGCCGDRGHHLPASRAVDESGSES